MPEISISIQFLTFEAREILLKTRRKKPSFWPAIVSTALVLFVLGLLALVSIYTNQLIDYLKENVQMVVYFNTGTKEEKVNEIWNQIKRKEYVKETKYVSSTEAAELFKAELGEDFTEVLGGNPLPPSIEVYLKGSKLDRNKLKVIESELKALPMVYEVSSQSDLIDDINNNKQRAYYLMLAVGVILIIVAFVLINSTVRLAIYSKRFLIKSMQLVGATEWFIIKPFIRNSIGWVMLGSVIAVLLLGGVYVYGATWIGQNIFAGQTDFFSWGSIKKQLPIFVGIFAFLLLAGLLIIIPGTYVSTKRYLSLKIDDLY